MDQSIIEKDFALAVFANLPKAIAQRALQAGMYKWWLDFGFLDTSGAKQLCPMAHGIGAEPVYCGYTEIYQWGLTINDMLKINQLTVDAAKRSKLSGEIFSRNLTDTRIIQEFAHSIIHCQPGEVKEALEMAVK